MKADCFFAALLASFILVVGGSVKGQQPFQLPTANHALFEPGHELEFLAPTTPDRPWTTGSFGCVRNNGRKMHEGLDIRSLQHDRHGEPTDPVMATADGTICYINTKPSLSNYGKYIVIRHVVDGLEIYSLYAHLSEIQAAIIVGGSVRQGQIIAIMGRTSNTSERIGKERAHVHFELNLFVNEKFASWFHQASPGERNDHGIWNGQNLTGIDPRQILLAENSSGGGFNMLQFLRNQTELCRVVVRATSFPYLKRYPALVLRNPAAEKEGIAGYEIALNYNGVAFALLPRAASEIKGAGRIQLLSVNEAEYRANPCRKYVKQRGSHWQLTGEGLRQVEMLIY
jgi:murein DD-endopeptidase MepM/ murein hydrolase activator NlpD